MKDETAKLLANKAPLDGVNPDNANKNRLIKQLFAILVVIINNISYLPQLLLRNIVRRSRETLDIF